MWIAGHLAVVEGRLQQMLHGTPNPVQQSYASQQSPRATNASHVVSR
jgi:hypothetical protein